MMDSMKRIIKKYIREESFLFIGLKTIYTFFRKIFHKCLNIPDYYTEINFWDFYLPQNWEALSNPEAKKRIFPEPLINYIREFKNINDDLKVFELGSGPVSLLTWGADNNFFQIFAVDALADVYEKIMKKYNYSCTIKPVKGYGEKLLKLVNKNSFSIIYSSNALDHVKSPDKCIRNMYEILKKGGIIYLEGYTNEGAREGFRGLHHFNLQPINGNLFCSNKKKSL